MVERQADGLRRPGVEGVVGVDERGEVTAGRRGGQGRDQQAGPARRRRTDDLRGFAARPAPRQIGIEPRQPGRHGPHRVGRPAGVGDRPIEPPGPQQRFDMLSGRLHGDIFAFYSPQRQVSRVGGHFWLNHQTALPIEHPVIVSRTHLHLTLRAVVLGLSLLGLSLLGLYGQSDVLQAQSPRARMPGDYGLDLLNSVGAIRQLSPDKAALHYPVAVSATVTFADPIWRTLYVQDATGGILVRLDAATEVKVGDRLQIDGAHRRRRSAAAGRRPARAQARHGQPARLEALRRRPHVPVPR